MSRPRNHWDRDIAAAHAERARLKAQAREEQKAKAAKLYAEGLEKKTIAIRLGISEGKVAALIREAAE